MSDRDLLFGIALHQLVTNAILNLNNSNKESVFVREIIEQIFIDRPELKQYYIYPLEKRNLYKRIHHILKKLDESNLIKIELKSSKNIAIKYFIIYTKINK